MSGSDAEVRRLERLLQEERQRRQRFEERLLEERQRYEALLRRVEVSGSIGGGGSRGHQDGTTTLNASLLG